MRGERREDATTAEPKAEEGTEYEREAGSSSHHLRLLEREPGAAGRDRMTVVWSPQIDSTKDSQSRRSFVNIIHLCDQPTVTVVDQKQKA